MIREGVVYRENSRTYSVVYYVQLKFGIIHLATACYAHLHATINPLILKTPSAVLWYITIHMAYIILGRVGVFNIRG